MVVSSGSRFSCETIASTMTPNFAELGKQPFADLREGKITLAADPHTQALPSGRARTGGFGLEGRLRGWPTNTGGMAPLEAPEIEFGFGGRDRAGATTAWPMTRWLALTRMSRKPSKRSPPFPMDRPRPLECGGEVLGGARPLVVPASSADLPRATFCPAPLDISPQVPGSSNPCLFFQVRERTADGLRRLVGRRFLMDRRGLLWAAAASWAAGARCAAAV